MGQRRRVAGVKECASCGAKMDKPCINRTTKKEMKNYHKDRMWYARDYVLNKRVAMIEGYSDEEFWTWAGWYLNIDGKSNFDAEYPIENP